MAITSKLPQNCTEVDVADLKPHGPMCVEKVDNVAMGRGWDVRFLRNFEEHFSYNGPLRNEK